jgi:hypothetical protein
MTEQQEHLINLLQQRQSLSQETTEKRELLLKVQGAIEYLTQIGVTLPESDPAEEVEETEESEY